MRQPRVLLKHLVLTLCLGITNGANAQEFAAPNSDEAETTDSKSVVSSLPTDPSYPSSIWLSVGASPSGNISGAVGFRRNAIGIEIGGVGGGTQLPGGTRKYGIPHNDFTVNGDYTSGAYGGDLLLFLPSSGSSRFLIYGGPGVYFQDTTQVVQSNVTGWYYENGTSIKTQFAGGGGVRIRVTPRIEVGAGYHSIRGV